MLVVAGPSGAGKSSVFSIYDSAELSAFSQDDRKAELNAIRLGRSDREYRSVPAHIHERAGRELQAFIEESIAARRPFTFETTLRPVTFEQMAKAVECGFLVEMIFVAAGPVEEHIRRVRNRAHAGGHSASEPKLREIFARGMEFLVKALEENRQGAPTLLSVWDNSVVPRLGEPPRPKLVLRMFRGVAQLRSAPPPPWFTAAVAGTPFQWDRLL